MHERRDKPTIGFFVVVATATALVGYGLSFLVVIVVGNIGDGSLLTPRQRELAKAAYSPIIWLLSRLGLWET